MCMFVCVNVCICADWLGNVAVAGARPFHNMGRLDRGYYAEQCIGVSLSVCVLGVCVGWVGCSGGLGWGVCECFCPISL